MISLSGEPISTLIASTAASGKMSRSLKQVLQSVPQVCDKLGVVDDDHVKEDSDRHDCSCGVHEICSKPECKMLIRIGTELV